MVKLGDRKLMKNYSLILTQFLNKTISNKNGKYLVTSIQHLWQPAEACVVHEWQKPAEFLHTLAFLDSRFYFGSSVSGLTLTCGG
jgi:hypothetical protein